MLMFKNVQQFQSRLGKEGSMLEPAWDGSVKIMEKAVKGTIITANETWQGTKNIADKFHPRHDIQNIKNLGQKLTNLRKWGQNYGKN